ncbi:MAG: hypothetical protein K6A40_13360, partial [Solobacterium sp.]|nr:hypothetical protein [Solobacterium sp.]
MKRKRRNYWDQLIDDPSVRKEDLFLKIRDLYIGMMKHIYNDPKYIPDVRMYFSTERRTVEQGMEKGYPVAVVSHRTNKIETYIIEDISKIDNFDNSYSWYQNDVFVVIDFRENGISPLQFITGAFFSELMRQISTLGMKRLKISHMYEPLISSGVAEFFYGFYLLDINLIQTLSALTYEGAYIDCTIYVPKYIGAAEKRTKKAGLDIVLSDPVAFSVENLRQIRKLVELSDRYVALVINDAGKIIGLTTGDLWPSECKVRIWGHLSWTITYEENKKISFYNARYHIHTQTQSNFNITKCLGPLGKGLNEEQIYNIEKVIRAAARQRHGTIIIIGTPDAAESESLRLRAAKTATGILPVYLHEKIGLMTYLTSIDGAVIIDTDCKCICIGAILDGDAVTKGT